MQLGWDPLGLAQLAFLPIGTRTSGPVDTGGCGKKGEEVAVRKDEQEAVKAKRANGSEGTQLGN